MYTDESKKGIKSTFHISLPGRMTAFANGSRGAETHMRLSNIYSTTAVSASNSI